MTNPFRDIIRFLAVAGLVAVMGAMAPPVLAQPSEGASGLPLPRFVSLRSSPVNVRVGPGTRYEIAWVYLRPGLPLEIIQEFDTWRKVRDFQGAEGWLHQNLVVGNRTAIVTPWTEEGQIALRANERADSPVRAWLRPGLMVDVRRCTGTVCEVGLAHRGETGRTTNYRGFVDQQALWGVYADERFN